MSDLPKIVSPALPEFLETRKKHGGENDKEDKIWLWGRMLKMLMKLKF